MKQLLAAKILSELDSIENESEQEISSAATSVNILPRTFNVASFVPGTINLDYGGGRFDKATEYLSSLGVTNFVYDPYNRSAEHNNTVIQAIKDNGGADTITCNNVLNVIKEDGSRARVIRNIALLLKNGGTAYFCVYKGDGSGVGKETSAGYQLNKPTKMYLPEISKYFSSVKIHRDIIVAQ